MDSHDLKDAHEKAIIAKHSVLILQDAMREIVDLGGGIPGDADLYCAKIHKWLHEEFRTIEEEIEKQCTES